MSKLQQYRESRDLAHVAPLMGFMAFFLVLGLMESFGFTSTREGMPWYRFAPEQWVYPLQTIVIGGLLIFFRQHYELTPVRGVGFGIAMGVLGIIVWLAPGHVFRTMQMEPHWLLAKLGFAERTEGFDPSFIKNHSQMWFVVAVFFRFLRMVVVVALIEEIFWRGFLMRYLVDMDGDYWQVPFGKFSWKSFFGVTLGVVLIHSPVDYGAAAVYGMLAYLVAVRTRSLSACVAMHATANLCLGIYTLSTGQWGYW